MDISSEISEDSVPKENEESKMKEKYLREGGKIEDLGEGEPDEGHTREWEDRARVTDDKDSTAIAQQPNQSNVPEIKNTDGEKVVVGQGDTYVKNKAGGSKNKSNY